MARTIFVRVDGARPEQRADVACFCERRCVLGAKRRRNADVHHADRARQMRALTGDVPELQVRKRDRDVRTHGRTHRRARVGVHARGNVERDLAHARIVDERDDAREELVDRSIEPRAEERIDDDFGAGE